MGRLYKGRLLWNAFPGSLLFVACRAGMKRSRKAGMFFVVFRGLFFQTTPSRVVFQRLFSKPPLRALFFGGFSPKTAFPCAWKCCFRRGRRGMSLVWMGESGKAHRRLSFLRCFFECFAFQLLGHVTRLHVHIVDVLFAIVAARGTFAAQHQRVVA